MKELKFRAWNNRMYYDVVPLSNTEIIEVLSLTGHARVQHVVEVMQFTGLKDKNGQDIYELDIITQIGYNPDKHEAFTANSVVVWDQDNCEYHLEEVIGFKINPKPSDYKVLTGSFSEGIECEVIGNVYVNPELLSEKTEERKSPNEYRNYEIF